MIKKDGGMPAIITKEVFQKAKEMYLLTGLIYCGHCGSAMQSNRRKPKNKPKYVSYMCGCRVQKRGCDNKKIRR